MCASLRAVRMEPKQEEHLKETSLEKVKVGTVVVADASSEGPSVAFVC